MSVKQLLFNVLQDAVGDFVVGLTPEHLKLGLWSGKIELTDLEVNVEAVRKLGLPASVKEGRVAALELDIPWTALGSSPVRVFIRGVSVTACAKVKVKRAFLMIFLCARRDACVAMDTW